MKSPAIDDFWRRQFRKLLAQETGGRSPMELADRWLVLASLTWKNRRHRVSFDVPISIYHILDDPDVRAKDKRYAQRQWAEGLEWIHG